MWYSNFRLLTRLADYLQRRIIADGKKKKEKKVDKLPTLVDNVHLKSKGNLYKKNFTNLKTNLYQLAFLQFKLLCVIKLYTIIS